MNLEIHMVKVTKTDGNVLELKKFQDVRESTIEYLP
jgi:hypothetical protein